MTLFLSLLLAATITSKADVRRVQPAELHELMTKGEAVVIDVRGTVPYKRGRIVGAFWLPLGHLNQRAGELPEDKLIVAYCTCKAEETSLDAAMRLSALGFENLAVLKGGYAAWVEAGLPTEADVDEPASAPAAPGASVTVSSRLAPPAAVTCDRNELTVYAGTVTKYSRKDDSATLTIATSYGTTETVTAASFLLDGKPITASDWSRIEQSDGVLQPGMSAAAWICAGKGTIVDWRPGTTFSRAE